MHEPEGRLSDVVPDASQIMAGAGYRAMGRQWFGLSMEAYLESVCMYVCLEFYAVAARLEKHMPELVRVGQRWRRGPREEEPKSDQFDGQETSSWGGGAARVKGPSGRLHRQSPGGLGHTRAAYRGVALKLCGLSSSAGPRRRRAYGC